MSLNIDLCYRDPGKPGKILVLLIHGLGAPDTWDNQKADWRNLILSDSDLDGVDVGLVKYETAHLISGLFKISGSFNLLGRNITVSASNVVTIDELSKHLKTKLSTVRYRSYQKIVVVGHSMGGLIGLRYILNEFEFQRDVKRIGGFISYATPYNGSTFADFHKLFKPIHSHSQISQLEPNCEFLDNLIRTYSDFEDHLRQQILFNFCYGDKDPVVKKESAVPHTKRSITYTDGQTLGGDHGTVLDLPHGLMSTNYEVLQGLILDVLSPTDPPQFPNGIGGINGQSNPISTTIGSSNQKIIHQSTRLIIQEFEKYRGTLKNQFITRFPQDAQSQLSVSMDQVIFKLKSMDLLRLEKFLSLYHYSTYEMTPGNIGYQELWELLTLINVIYPNWNFIDPNDLFQLPNLQVEDSKWVRILYSLQKETMPEIIISFLSGLYSGAFRHFMIQGNQKDIFPYRFVLENVNNESLIPNTDENICEVCKGITANFSKILMQFGRTDNISVFEGLEPNYFAKEVSVVCTSCIRQARKEQSFEEVCRKLKEVI